MEEAQDVLPRPDQKTLADPAQHANPLTRKLHKILSGHDQRGGLGLNEDVLEGLRGLSDFFTDNSLRARRNLRSDLERRTVVVNEGFIEAFAAVKKQLDSVQRDIHSMASSCHEMTLRLASARTETSALITQTTKLRDKGAAINLQAIILNKFLIRYQLTPGQYNAITSKVISDDFFVALKRAKFIHDDCKRLLRTNQSAGLAIMEAMATLQESAYERLYRWTQATCRSLSNEASEPSHLLAKAMAALSDRPVLFQYSLNEISYARHTAVVRAFIDALTRGAVGGTPRPIEMHSHDPIRYTSDMLAWIHQCVASEREQLMLLLTPESGIPEYTHRRGMAMTDLPPETTAQLQTALDHIMEGTCRPLRVRIEQVLLSDSGLVMCYKIANILQFYGHTVVSLVHETAALSALLEDLRTFAMKVFLDRVNVHSANLLSNIELPSVDLSPISSLESTLGILRDILASHESSLERSETRQAELSKVLVCVLDPLLQMCILSASHLAACEMAVYMMNCVHRIQSVLTLYEFTDERVEMLEGQMAAYLDTLVHEQARTVLVKSGLGPLVTAMQEWETEVNQETRPPLSTVKDMDSQTVFLAMIKFDEFLSNADFNLFPQSDLLSSTRARLTIKDRGSSRFLRAYQRLYDHLHNPSNLYENPSRMVKRTPAQLESLL